MKVVNGIKKFVREAPVLVDVAKSVKDATRIMDRRGVEYAIVHERGRVLGVISIRDLKGNASKGNFSRSRGVSLRRLAKYSRTVSSDVNSHEAAAIFREHPEVKVLPVLESGVIVGILKPPH
ncbi:CBS domain-containing protein [Streptomyces sp. NPDC059957]|uniref:CBS domain-containing protein n=1 Tax=unclassified Streptomyces TaxID=2593676 RepID=UPI003657CC85